MKNSFSIILILFICFTSTVYSQKLDKSKKELTADSKKNSQTSSTTSSQSKKVDGDLAHPLLQIAGYVFLSAFKYGLIGDYKNENHLSSSLTPYPFYNETSGNYENYDTDTLTKNESRIEIENKFIYSSNDLFGNHLKAKIRPFQYFYLQTDWHQLRELEKISQTSNSLSLFHFTIGYDRIRFEKCNFGWTLGTSYIGNEVKKAGFSYGVNAEYFMGNHISFLAAGKWSKINSQPVNTFEFMGKFHRKKGYFLLGLEHLKIATPTYNFISLGGGVYF